jgi:hypothetical protein
MLLIFASFPPRHRRMFEMMASDTLTNGVEAMATIGAVNMISWSKMDVTNVIKVSAKVFITVSV